MAYYHQFLVVSVIVGFAVFQVCFVFEIPCNVSTSTVKVVSKCPTTFNEHKEAALKKNCEAILNKCPKSVYHCVRNWLGIELYEVCAPPLYILGSVCAEYNEDVMSIRSTVHSCKNFTPSCPERYISTEQYKYPICHKLLSLSNTTPHIERRTNKSQTQLPSNVENKKHFVYDLLWFALSVLAVAALTVAFTLLYRGIKMRKKIKPNDIEVLLHLLPKERQTKSSSDVQIEMEYIDKNSEEDSRISSEENNEIITQKEENLDHQILTQVSSENNEPSAIKTVTLQSFEMNLPSKVSSDAIPQKENNSDSQIGKQESLTNRNVIQESFDEKNQEETESRDPQTITEDYFIARTPKVENSDTKLYTQKPFVQETRTETESSFQQTTKQESFKRYLPTEDSSDSETPKRGDIYNLQHENQEKTEELSSATKIEMQEGNFDAKAQREEVSDILFISQEASEKRTQTESSVTQTERQEPSEENLRTGESFDAKSQKNYISETQPSTSELSEKKAKTENEPFVNQTVIKNISHEETIPETKSYDTQTSSKDFSEVISLKEETSDTQTVTQNSCEKCPLIKDSSDEKTPKEEFSKTQTVTQESSHKNILTSDSIHLKAQKKEKNISTEDSFSTKARGKENSDIQTKTENPTVMKASKRNVVEHPQEESSDSQKSTKVSLVNDDNEFVNPEKFIRRPLHLRNQGRSRFVQRPQSYTGPGKSFMETTDKEKVDMFKEWDERLSLRTPERFLKMRPRRRLFNSETTDKEKVDMFKEWDERLSLRTPERFLKMRPRRRLFNSEITDKKLDDVLNHTIADTFQERHLRRRHLSSVIYNSECNTKCKSPQKQQSDPTTWTPKEVKQHILEANPNLAPQAEAILRDDIDGEAFFLLEIDHMKNHLKFKLGPSLKLSKIIEKLKTQRLYEHLKRL